MPEDYVFMTDSDSDLSYRIADEKRIPVVAMPFTLDGRACMDDGGRSGIEKVLLDRMRAGSVPSTSQLPVPAYLEIFEPVLREKDLLFLSFSSAMSSTFQNILTAGEELLRPFIKGLLNSLAERNTDGSARGKT